VPRLAAVSARLSPGYRLPALGRPQVAPSAPLSAEERAPWVGSPLRHRNPFQGHIRPRRHLLRDTELRR
jgi:hypothetical protein